MTRQTLLSKHRLRVEFKRDQYLVVILVWTDSVLLLVQTGHLSFGPLNLAYDI